LDTLRSRKGRLEQPLGGPVPEPIAHGGGADPDRLRQLDVTVLEG
jgi:hypothetical protein